MYPAFLHPSKLVTLIYHLNLSSQIPCVVSNVRGLGMDRTHVVANFSVPAVVFQTTIVRHAQKILSVPTARETTVHTREFPRWKFEKEVQQVRVHNRLSFPEARKLVEITAPTVADKSYAAAAAPKRATKSVAINTELTWHFSEAKYKKTVRY